MIQESLSLIEKQGKSNPTKFYYKLKERIQELMGSSSIEDERIFREVALYAEKVDITEEITRLYSHLKQAFSLLKEKNKKVGRPLDFIAQEMQREINTISAKSPALEIINVSLFIKAELEKIREQVQNIE
jgi:uncharacterized protein (TIGR00255 family)